MTKRKELKLAFVLVLASLVVSLGIVEVSLRLSSLPDPWTTQNFTVDPVNQQVSNLAIQYDPVLGYIARPGFRGPIGKWISSHGEMGVRLNANFPKDLPLPPLPKGGIVAVGDSFTYGSEVDDSESWPAQLEAILGVPVVNAGAGGYGIDQAVLRAEQLLDAVRPSAIIVSFIPNAVERNQRSVETGLVRPYFDVVGGRLELRNVPVPYYRPTAKHIGRARAILGYSYTAYWVANRFGKRTEWLVFEYETRNIHNKGVEVSCLLWPRLAERVVGRNTRLIALAQYAGIHVSGHDTSRKDRQVEKILDCARQAGFLVVDSYSTLRQLFEQDPAAFWPLWVKQANDKDKHTGHMSVAGNRFTAELVSRAIRSELPELLPTIAGHEL